MQYIYHLCPLLALDLTPSKTLKIQFCATELAMKSTYLVLFLGCLFHVYYLLCKIQIFKAYYLKADLCWLFQCGEIEHTSKGVQTHIAKKQKYVYHVPWYICYTYSPLQDIDLTWHRKLNQYIFEAGFFSVAMLLSEFIQ